MEILGLATIPIFIDIIISEEEISYVKAIIGFVNESLNFSIETKLEKLKFILFLLLIIILIKNVFYLLYSYFSSLLDVKINTLLRKNLLISYLDYSYEQHSKIDVSLISRNLTTEVEQSFIYISNF